MPCDIHAWFVKTNALFVILSCDFDEFLRKYTELSSLRKERCMLFKYCNNQPQNISATIPANFQK